MLAGGTTVVIDHLTGEKEPPHLKSILKKLFTSPPFTFYLLMLFYVYDWLVSAIAFASYFFEIGGERPRATLRFWSCVGGSFWVGPLASVHQVNFVFACGDAGAII